MKKLFLTIIVSLALCGSAFAQAQSHWPEFNPNYTPYEMQGALVAAIIIDGEPITVEYEGWDALEVSAWVNDACRANNIYLNDEFVQEFGDPYPVTWGDAVFYTNPGEELTFKMYDHSRDIEYVFVTALQYGEPLTLVTGDDHFEGWDNPDDVISLSFTTGSTPAQTFTKDIAGYGTEGGNWYLVSSPIGEVAATDVDNMTTGTYDLYYFDQAQELEWINYEDLNDGGFNLVPGKGYLYANSADVTLSFTGTPYHGDGIIPLQYDAAEFGSWNLVGNPFGEPATINHPFYVMNSTRSEIVVAETETVEPMQGIFVIANEDGETITFSPATAVAPEVEKSRLTLNLIQGRNVIDRAVVNFGKGTLPKFQINPNSTKVYIPVDGEDFAVASANATGEMPVSFKAAKNGNYTLSFTSQEVTFTYLHLIDNMTGNDVNLLSTPSYNFDARTTDYASRFRLVFATGSSIDGDSFGFVNGMGNLCIFGIEGEATLQVVDVLGHVISSNQFSGSYESKLNVAPGTYMLRLIQGDNVMVQKMVIK